MSEKLIIIGAGIAGLSAGCYGQMNGFDTTIYEMHTLPGGLCTSWKRQGYTVDGCVHWLVGSGGGAFGDVWDELGALRGMPIHDHEAFARHVSADGREVVFYTDADRLEAHLLDIAPEDREHIERLCRWIRRFGRHDMGLPTPREAMGLRDGLKMAPRLLHMLPALATIRRYTDLTVDDFAQRFENPLLREAISGLFGGFEDFPVIGLAMTFAWMHRRDAGYPIGGSLTFARNIARRYEELGGHIEYRAPVERILVEGGRAVGVRLENGDEHRADEVISAADGHTTLFEMLQDRYTPPEVRRWYDEQRIFPPMVQVSFGVARDIPELRTSTSIPLDEPIELPDRSWDRLSARCMSYDPNLAPEGHSVVVVNFPSAYEPWRALREEGDAYETAKGTLANRVMRALDARYPGFAEDFRMVDVATPVTWKRYTGNWQGSMEGWFLSTEVLRGMLSGGTRIPKELPGLDGFMMVGQWVEPGGGLPPAATSGRGAIQVLCKRRGRSFVTTRAT